MQADRVDFQMICSSFLPQAPTCKEHLHNTAISQTDGTEVVCASEEQFSATPPTTTKNE